MTFGCSSDSRNKSTSRSAKLKHSGRILLTATSLLSNRPLKESEEITSNCRKHPQTLTQELEILLVDKCSFASMTQDVPRIEYDLSNLEPSIWHDGSGVASVEHVEHGGVGGSVGTHVRIALRFSSLANAR